MSIEDLANIKVSSVSKSAEPLSDAPAAIFVISHDDIIRSGATSIPEMLRLAPNLHVARINASHYAISARGFNGSAADKLLVLIDGRTVYSPFFNGVQWDLQGVPPENIDRIEVISGPGATLWGANAVNGVINIVTRGAAETQGGVATAGAGNLELRGGLQYGGKVGDTLAYRAYGEGFSYANGITAAGTNARDDWYKQQTGFRIDWTPPGDLITLQGDAYRGNENKLIGVNQAIEGRNIIARWTHPMADGSALRLQAYYDFTNQSNRNVFDHSLQTYDVDLQHSFPLGTRQQVVWGGGYRLMQDDFPANRSLVPAVFFIPQGRTLQQSNIFVEDTVALADGLKLVAGTKLELDPFSRPKVLPSLRLAWKATGADLLWAAVSRAVRAPSRLDRDLTETVGRLVAIAGDDFQPEKLIAYELGYRAQPMPGASISVSTFYNVYSDLRSGEKTNGGFPIVFGNRLEGDSYGVEIWGAYRVTEWWRLAAGFDWLRKNLHFQAGSSNLTSQAIAGDDPAYQFSLRSTINPVRDVAFELALRGVGALPNPPSPAYVELNTRLGWAVSKSVEVSVRGENLLHDHHFEFGSTNAPIQLGPVGVRTGRSVFFETRVRF